MVTIPITGLLIAAIGGAAIGLERQRSGHATGPRARFGGIRTFTLLGGLGGVAGALLAAGWPTLAAATFAAPAALVVAAYVAGSRDDIDATTEVAALVVLTAGVLSGAGQTMPAPAVVAVTAVLLLEKTRLHAMAKRVDDVALGMLWRRGASDSGRYANRGRALMFPIVPPSACRLATTVEERRLIRLN